MTRIHHARPQPAPIRAGVLDQPRAALRKKKPYKIVLEAVTQEKKKLHSIVRRHSAGSPPPTNTLAVDLCRPCPPWIRLHPCWPPGIHRVVQRAVPPAQSRRAHCLGQHRTVAPIPPWCTDRLQAKPKNKTHADPEKLSHHVHRVGHHFPLDVITPACSKFGYVYDNVHGLRKARARDRDNWIAQQVENYSSRQLPHGGPTTEKETKDHTRGAVREMFPKIPEADLSSIVNHAFEEVDSLYRCTDLPAYDS